MVSSRAGVVRAREDRACVGVELLGFLGGVGDCRHTDGGEGLDRAEHVEHDAASAGVVIAQFRSGRSRNQAAVQSGHRGVRTPGPLIRSSSRVVVPGRTRRPDRLSHDAASGLQAHELLRGLDRHRGQRRALVDVSAPSRPPTLCIVAGAELSRRPMLGAGRRLGAAASTAHDRPRGDALAFATAAFSAVEDGGCL